MRKEFFLLFIGIIMMPSGVLACSCIGKGTVKQAVKASDVVIVGEIISKELVTLTDSTFIAPRTNDFFLEMSIFKYEMVVTAYYKGKVNANLVEIYTGLGNGDCGISFTVGQSYIVYASKETYYGQKNNDWTFPKGKNICWTNSCTRTILENDKEISEIEKYKKRKVIR